MSETTTNPGKGMGVTGFVLSLVGIVGYFIVGIIAAGQAALTGGGFGTMIFWAVFCAIALLLSFMGYRKSAAVKMKNGLAIAGIVIAVVALLLSIWAAMGIRAAANDPKVKELRDKMHESMEGGMEGLQHTLDSLANEERNH